MRKMILAISMNICIKKNTSSIPFRFMLKDLNVYFMHFQGHVFVYAYISRFSKHKTFFMNFIYSFLEKLIHENNNMYLNEC